MPEPITYGDLEATLQEFGFEREEVPGSHRTFRHPASGALLLLPCAPLDREAHHFHYGQVRDLLADYGFVPRDKFFEVVRSHGRVAG
jgi:predicted RNA binding protein YcfA (HicA-like mRNA interferase family)